MSQRRLAHLRDQTTWRAQGTQSLRWLVFFVRLARRAEASGDNRSARFAWLGAWRRVELRTECERWYVDELVERAG